MRGWGWERIGRDEGWREEQQKCEMSGREISLDTRKRWKAEKISARGVIRCRNESFREEKKLCDEIYEVEMRGGEVRSRYESFREIKMRGWETNGIELHVGWETRSGSWFNIKMPYYQCRKSHCEDKTVVRSSYLHNGISYTGKMTSLYWIRAPESEVEKWNVQGVREVEWWKVEMRGPEMVEMRG